MIKSLKQKLGLVGPDISLGSLGRTKRKGVFLDNVWNFLMDRGQHKEIGTLQV